MTQDGRIESGDEIMRKALDRCIKIGGAHLRDKIKLLNLIERALMQLMHEQPSQARVLLERAVREVKIGDGDV